MISQPGTVTGVFTGFERVRIDTGEAVINAVHAGTGPPVLLLHGFPQTCAMWHAVAPELATDHTVVAADLRGYGDSSRPPSGPDHAAYSFRAMAADQVAVMRSLGHERFAVVGHDRGARVAHRLALDHPDTVTRLALLDILPTTHMYETVDRALATAYYHWFLFIQPEPVPELLLGADPVAYLHTLLGGWGSGLGAFAPDALAEYERAFADAGCRHAMLEDYRAGASIDLEHDRADAGRRVEVPTMVMWGGHGVVGNRPADPLAVWAERAANVTGAVVDAGHFLVEERPGETLAELRAFLDGPGPRAPATSGWQAGHVPLPGPEGYEIDDDPERIDLDVVWSFLSREAYWSRWRTREDVTRQVSGAWRVVGAYRQDDGALVGFARAVCDGIALGYLADVFVVAAHRGQGLGARLVAAVIDEGPGAGFRWLLHTADAHQLYARFGFAAPGATLLERPGARPAIAEAPPDPSL